jgi:hypothetical protein
VIRIGEGPTAADRHETRIAVFREDHSQHPFCSYLPNVLGVGALPRSGADGGRQMLAGEGRAGGSQIGGRASEDELAGVTGPGWTYDSSSAPKVSKTAVSIIKDLLHCFKPAAEAVKRKAPSAVEPGRGDYPDRRYRCVPVRWRRVYLGRRIAPPPRQSCRWCPPIRRGDEPDRPRSPRGAWPDQVQRTPAWPRLVPPRPAAP